MKAQAAFALVDCRILTPARGPEPLVCWLTTWAMIVALLATVGWLTNQKLSDRLTNPAPAPETVNVPLDQATEVEAATVPTLFVVHGAGRVLEKFAVTLRLLVTT